MSKYTQAVLDEAKRQVVQATNNYADIKRGVTEGRLFEAGEELREARMVMKVIVAILPRQPWRSGVLR